jgi:hypothetical protein
MDNKGLNVAQTDPTSDYVQGHEDTMAEDLRRRSLAP